MSAEYRVLKITYSCKNIITLLDAYFITEEADGVKPHSGQQECVPHVFKTSLLMRLFEHNTALVM